jgi:tRNA-uridine 2-sulfurtransferase
MEHIDSLSKKRIAVALSGGVDSAVAAALLQAQGAQVVALTMRLQPDDRLEDAVRVAERLGIEHHIVDCVAPFAACVMQDFAKAYARGETPVPCVQCNRFIKFGALLQVAKDKGAAALATGHYVRRLEREGGSAQLHKGQDATRDQSYFLFALSQEQIDFLRFPLGAMTKEQVRALAAQQDLPVAQKPDSQDICFVPEGDYISVLRKLCPEAIVAGEIVDQQGHVLGRHQGIVHFTVGQRKGLDLSDRTGDHNEPLFVLELDALRARVIVGPREALAMREVFLRDINWLAGPVPPEGVEVMARLRSAQQPAAARFYVHGKQGGRLVMAASTYGVAKGQAGVLYQGSQLLGGGWICGSQNSIS